VLLPGKKIDIFKRTLYNPLGVVDPLVADPYKKDNIKRWANPNQIWPPIIPEPTKVQKSSLLQSL